MGHELILQPHTPHPPHAHTTPNFSCQIQWHIRNNSPVSSDILLFIHHTILVPNNESSDQTAQDVQSGQSFHCLHVKFYSFPPASQLISAVGTSFVCFTEEELPCDEASLLGLLLSRSVSFLWFSITEGFNFSRGEMSPFIGDVFSWKTNTSHTVFQLERELLECTDRQQKPWCWHRKILLPSCQQTYFICRYVLFCNAAKPVLSKQQRESQKQFLEIDACLIHVTLIFLLWNLKNRAQLFKALLA